MSSNVVKMTRTQLTAMVVGGMIGAGIFSLPRTFAGATGPLGAVVAWLIAGLGMYTLARVFQLLAERKPDLDAGVFAYAKEGFGDYPGFLSAFGYWIGSCIGNVSYWVLIKSTLGAFFPIFGDGNTVVAILVASAGIWLFHFMILRGVQQAAAINKVASATLDASYRGQDFHVTAWQPQGKPAFVFVVALRDQRWIQPDVAEAADFDEVLRNAVAFVERVLDAQLEPEKRDTPGPG